jgi:hypothetical protein
MIPAIQRHSTTSTVFGNIKRRDYDIEQIYQEQLYNQLDIDRLQLASRNSAQQMASKQDEPLMAQSSVTNKDLLRPSRLVANICFLRP